MVTKRSLRRHHFDRIKRKAAKLLLRWHIRFVLMDGWEITRRLNHMAETHCCPCSCYGCTGHKDVPPRRERGALEEEIRPNFVLAEEKRDE